MPKATRHLEIKLPWQKGQRGNKFVYEAHGHMLSMLLKSNECGYLYENNTWFALGERTYYSATEFYLPVRMEDAWGNATEMEYDPYILFPAKITDALGNETLAGYDYRVLQPFQLTDPNGNATEVAFDTLGMVAKLAITGKNGEGDTLTNPTEIYDYDIHCWEMLQKPVYAHVRKREIHADPNTRWIESYVYSNGFGEEIMTKTTAADGLAWTIENDLPVEVETDHRWRASGKVIVNNKNKPVKQYEPWYSVTSDFEDEERLTLYGVTPILHYDPLSRLIQTDFPDNTMTKVVFDGWQQKNYDQNDCDTQSPHYNTPQVLDLDVLGRPFQTIDDNGTFGFVTTHNQLDITGRIVQVTDALGRTATQNKFALSEKHQVYVENIDSGKRWMINDTAGNRRYLWDSRSHRLQTGYDVLLRPVETLLITGNNSAIATQKITYGTNAALNNIGQVVEVKAQDGQTSFEYDFKGNVTKQTKQFAQDYQNELDWNGTPVLLNETFIQETTYDALNRPVTVTQPDNTVVANIYDKGGLLKQVLHNSTQHITNITYNPREQRENIYYGNTTKTRYYYNPLNFRLTRILTTRNNGQDVLQDLNYTYDAAGNITAQQDNAQQTFYFNNAVIAPTGSYTYDALYRLLTATGREQTALAMPTDTDFPNNIPCPDTASNAMQNYTQHYSYDALGNMLQMQSAGNWTRNYEYNNPMNNNYLLGHGGGTVYTYDAHGNMLTMPHLTSMVWDYLDQLHSAGNGTFTSYYNYDAEGNRTRKVVVKNNIREERYYVNGYEIYRKYTNDVLDFERKTINISDDEKVFVRIEQKTGENPVIRYQYDNHLGSACLELDELGAIISYEEYHPFGTTSYRSGRTETEVSLKRYKYCGKERDEEIGLYYYGMRYYAAWLCRFVSVDPLQFKYPYYTPYQYAGNKPITFIDLDGGEEKEPEEDNNISKIKITGEQADIDSFINMLNTRTGSEYEITKEGYLRLISNNNILKSTKEVSSDLNEMLNELICSQVEIPITLVRDSENALFDNFDKALVDIGDLEKVHPILQAAFMGHFLAEWSSVEGYNNPENRKNTYDIAHKEHGLKMESIIANAMLGQKYKLVKDLGTEFVETSSQNQISLDQGDINVTTGGYYKTTVKYGKTKFSYNRNVIINQSSLKNQNGIVKKVNVSIKIGNNIVP